MQTVPMILGLVGCAWFSASASPETLEDFQALSRKNLDRAEVHPLTHRSGVYAPDETLALHGVTSLSTEQAATLADFHGRVIWLPDLATLEPEAAESLVQFSPDAPHPGGRGRIQLSGLTALEAETAEALARWDGFYLSLGMDALEPESAEALTRFRGVALILDVDTLDLETATALTGTPKEELEFGELHLDHLQALDPTVASALARWAEWVLTLDGVQELDVSTAETLATYGSSLSLGGVKTLEPEIAAALAGHGGMELFLDGVTDLQPESAAALARWEGRILGLSGVTALDVETATALAAWEGYEPAVLRLNGLTRLDPYTAKALATWEGRYLQLKGLETLDLATATALSRWEGKQILLDSLSDVEPGVADALGRHRLPGCCP